MSRSLRVIQVIMKIAKVISLLVFIFGVIASILTIASAVGLFVFPFEQYEIDGENLKSYLERVTELSLTEFGAVMILSAISLTAGVINVKIQHGYLVKEVRDGTPFTEDGATKLRRASFACILISVASFFATLVLHNIFVFKGMITGTYDLSSTFNIGWYLLLLFLSVVFSYGAEQASIKK